MRRPSPPPRRCAGGVAEHRHDVQAWSTSRSANWLTWRVSLSAAALAGTEGPPDDRLPDDDADDCPGAPTRPRRKGATVRRETNRRAVKRQRGRLGVARGDSEAMSPSAAGDRDSSGLCRRPPPRAGWSAASEETSGLGIALDQPGRAVVGDPRARWPSYGTRRCAHRSMACLANASEPWFASHASATA